MSSRRAPVRRLDAYFLDVGQGDCTVIMPPEGAPLIFDIKDAHVARMFFSNREPAVPELAAVLFSHLDDDHISGGVQFLTDFLDHRRGVIDRVYIDVDRPLRDGEPGAARARELIDFLLERFGQARAIQAPRATSTPIAAGDGWKVFLVAPEQALVLMMTRGHVRPPHNLFSAVLRVEFGGRAMLVGGDALLPTWAAMDGTTRAADVVRISHHGGALDEAGTPPGWNASRLYQEMNPRFAAISVGTKNPHGHPDPEWVEPLFQTRGCFAACTQVTRHCEPAIGNDPMLAERLVRDSFGRAEAEPAWRHRHDARTKHARMEIPCAGTLRVSLHEDGHITMTPGRTSNHQSVFIPLLGQPLCRRHGV